MRPVLEYGCQVWNPYLVKHFESIESIQKRGIRVICRSEKEYKDSFELRRKFICFEGPEGGLPIPFPSHHFFPNPTNQCPDPTDMLTKHQSHSHIGFFSDSNPSPSDRNPIFPVQKQANPNSHLIPFRTLCLV